MKKEILKHINQNGFYFNQFKPDEKFLAELFNGETPSPYVHEKTKKILTHFGLPVDQLQLVYEDINLGEYHEMHTHLIPADLQVIIWGIKGHYTGRDFKYGTKDHLKSFYPKFGDICFMKTNDLNFIHGVSPLKSGHKVRTLLVSVNCLGLLGEHVTVDAKNLEVC